MSNTSIESVSREARVFRAFTRSDNVAGMILKNEVEREPSAAKHDFFKSLVEICQRGLDEGVFRAGLSPEQARKAQANALEMAFLPAEEKAALCARKATSRL